MAVQRTLLVLLVVVVTAGLAAGAWWLTRSKAPVPALAVGPSTNVPSGVEATRTPGADDGSERLTAAPTTPEFGSLDTTVVFPLEVELELVHATETPQAEGAPALGSGAKSQLKGSILGSKGEGVRAEIEFVAGTNQGRVLYSDSSGAFGAKDLYPGLSIVRVSGPGIVGSQREVRLRQDREWLLNINYSRLSQVSGTVFDAQSKPLAGANVSFDGQPVVSEENGTFSLPTVAPGNVLVTVSKPGFAAYRENLTVSLAVRTEAARLQFRLDPSARLQVSIVEPLNSSEQAWLYILPGDGASQRKFPWHTVNPVRVWPGGTATIEDLPSGSVSLRLFHAGATAKPPRTAVMLGAGETANVEFHLEPAPVVQGKVTDRGSPAGGAAVVLEAPNRTEATLSVFGETNYLYLENEVFPNLPPAVQIAKTNALGEFTLSANETASAVRYLTATSSDGRRVAHAVLQAGMKRVDLALEPVAEGSGELRFVMSGRSQPLPVKVSVNGSPRDAIMLPSGRDLAVGGLPRGSWLASVKWNGEVLLQKAPVQIEGEVTLELTLPPGAINGQDADTIRRAGKH